MTPAFGTTFGHSSRLVYAVGLTVAVACLSAVAVYFDGFQGGSQTAGEPVSFQLICYGKLLLIGASISYVVHFCNRSVAVGRWASALAAAGTLDIGIGLLLRMIQSGAPLDGPALYLSDLYEVILLFVVVLMAVYLAIEATYCSRAAGAVVVPVLTAASAFELWLTRLGDADLAALSPVLRLYWQYATVAGTVLGYMLLAFGAGLSSLWLFRALGERAHRLARVVARIPELSQLDHLAVRAKLIGFTVMLVAALLWEALAFDGQRAALFLNPIEPWVLALLVAYAGFFVLRVTGPRFRRHSAAWAVAIFVATLIGLARINLLLLGSGA